MLDAKDMRFFDFYQSVGEMIIQDFLKLSVKLIITWKNIIF